MNILYSTDDNYFPYMAVSIFSLLKANKTAGINFYIFDLGITENNKEALRQLVNRFGHSVSFITIDKTAFAQFPQTISYISVATYARLKAAEYLPKVKKIIYLDVDTLIADDLSSLYATNLGEAAIGAVKDWFIEAKTNNYKYKIGLTDKDTYFNAGVLLINLEKWRKLDVFNAAINWLKQYQNIIKYQDQDVLNGIFVGRGKLLNSRFNFTPEERGLVRGKQIPISFSSPIAIFHYCGPDKFWCKECTHTKANLGYRLFLQLNQENLFDFGNRFEKVNWRTKWQRIKRDLKDRIKYHIK